VGRLAGTLRGFDFKRRRHRDHPALPREAILIIGDINADVISAAHDREVPILNPLANVSDTAFAASAMSRIETPAVFFPSS
jgi:hypothetical protein